MGKPTPPPRSNRSSSPPLTGGVKEVGIEAGGAPKPAPICRSRNNMSLTHSMSSFIKQSKPNKITYSRTSSKVSTKLRRKKEAHKIQIICWCNIKLFDGGLEEDGWGGVKI